ncbi:MAG: c-type cytochrome [Thermaurantiacus sp.]
MDSYEWNRIAGAVLAAAIAILGLTIITGYLFVPQPMEQQAYVVEGVELETAAADAAEVERPISFYLAQASIERGQAAFRKCSACHTIEAGGANGIGPNLWGIMKERHAQRAGFNYSAAMRETADKIWDWDAMNEWLKNPRSYISGTSMAFAGISRAQERADLLLYMASMDPNPPTPPPPPAEEAPAEDSDPPAGESAEEAAADA